MYTKLLQNNFSGTSYNHRKKAERMLPREDAARGRSIIRAEAPDRTPVGQVEARLSWKSQF